jgi:hypothetical protein
MRSPDNSNSFAPIVNWHRPTVTRMLRHLCGREENVTILAGPFGIGKSTTLIPLVAQELRDAGFSVSLVGGSQSISLINDFTIIDEAGVLSSIGQQQLREIVQTVKNAGRRILPIIAHPVEISPDSDLRLWKAAFEKTKPKSKVDTIKLSALRLSKTDAWKYMKFEVKNYYAQDLGTHWEVAAKNLPGALPLLKNVADYCHTDGDNLGEMLHNIRLSIDFHLSRGTITRDEHRLAELGIKEIRRLS